MRLTRVNTSVEYVKFGGGLDLLTPAISINPGAALAAHNYEPGMSGGYARIDGYERFSGMPSPSDATYHHCQVVLSAAVSVGQTITGSVSGATGVLVTIGATEFNITKVTGTFTSSENFTVSGDIKGYMTALPTLQGCPTGLENATAQAAAADNYRADISVPMGSGAIRGGVTLNGTTYCFRDNVAGTAGLIFKATTSGWTQVTLYSTISYTTFVGVIADGTTITQFTSGATATVMRHIQDSATTGRLILSNITGTFNAVNVIQVGGVTKMTASSLVTAISILPGGRYECDVYNFTGSTDTRAVYGVDGVNPAFEFDGEVYIPIYTGMTADTPSHIKAHKKMLFLTFRGSLQNSAIGNPFSWSVITGASEIGLGDDITGLLTQPGDVMAVVSRNSSSQLSGTSVADFQMDSIAPEVGAIAYTLQNLGVAYWLDDRGVIQITRTQAFGNFDNATASRNVQPVIDQMRTVVIASTAYKSRNQYRLYGSDGSGVVMTVSNGQYGPEFAFTTFKYPVNVTCAWNAEDANGKFIVFFGSDNGMVYQADKGSSFDGAAIEAYLRLPFNHSKTPNVIKSYRRAQMEMTAVGYCEIRVHPEFGYGDPAVSTHLLNTVSVQGSGGYWDIDTWEQFYYDTTIVASPEFSISGDGRNMGLIAYSNSAIDLGHTLQGAVLSFTPRRIQR